MRRSLLLILALPLLALPAAGADKPSPQVELNVPTVEGGDRLATILHHFDQAQATIRTLEADFYERKELALLVEPLEARGHFYYSHPQQAKWEYSDDARVFLISDNTLMQYFPEKNLVEKKDLRAANTGRLFKLFGLGQTSKELKSLYSIALGEEESVDGQYMLILTPKRRVVRKRIDRVLLWVGDRDFLPRALRYEEGDGDTTLFRFENVRINTQLADNVFNLDLPSDVQVSDELSLFQKGKGGGG